MIISDTLMVLRSCIGLFVSLSPKVRVSGSGQHMASVLDRLESNIIKVMPSQVVCVLGINV